MKKWIISIVSIIAILVFLGVFFLNGYYTKSDFMVGNVSVYTYEPSILSGHCKGFEEVTLYQNDETIFFLGYQCDGRGYFIKHEGDYIRLDKALNLGIITENEIRNSGITVLEKDRNE